MQITATQHPLRVDYKIKGKFYNDNSFHAGQLGPDKATSAPFDSEVVQPNTSWQLPVDATVLGVHQLGIAVPH